MSKTLDEVTKDAISLSDAERAELALTLLQSLDEVSDSDVDAAWRSEIDRREKQLERGEATLLGADVVFARVRDRLG
ncbi:MAG TPA: addiction module protein [Chloroflexota bacterium]|jgi:putative addiction module component (TIGR02574 family)|nr:addiction module protein [Chloroflexota bacterium]